MGYSDRCPAVPVSSLPLCLLADPDLPAVDSLEFFFGIGPENRVGDIDEGVNMPLGRSRRLDTRCLDAQQRLFMYPYPVASHAPNDGWMVNNHSCSSM